MAALPIIQRGSRSVSSRLPASCTPAAAVRPPLLTGWDGEGEAVKDALVWAGGVAEIDVLQLDVSPNLRRGGNVAVRQCTEQGTGCVTLLLAETETGPAPLHQPQAVASRPAGGSGVNCQQLLTSWRLMPGASTSTSGFRVIMANSCTACQPQQKAPSKTQ
jgi:hypothetical protein